MPQPSIDTEFFWREAKTRKPDPARQPLPRPPRRRVGERKTTPPSPQASRASSSRHTSALATSPAPRLLQAVDRGLVGAGVAHATVGAQADLGRAAAPGLAGGAGPVVAAAVARAAGHRRAEAHQAGRPGGAVHSDERFARRARRRGSHHETDAAPLSGPELRSQAERPGRLPLTVQRLEVLGLPLHHGKHGYRRHSRIPELTTS